jgi:hypothetical protein
MFKKNNDLITCTGDVGVAHDEEAIIVTFRGTIGDDELNEEECKYLIVKCTLSVQF